VGNRREKEEYVHSFVMDFIMCSVSVFFTYVGKRLERAKESKKLQKLITLKKIVAH
jgi:hypothetical protein